MVEDEEALARLVKALEAAPVIAVDTESNSMYAYQERVCLLQFSVLDSDWIVDPLAVDDLSSLAAVLADPDKPTVLHGADYDIRCLKRDYGFQIRGLFDTLIAAQMLGMQKIGLADLLVRFFGVEVDKQFQRHDWGRRPLLTEHLDYARGDTHFLIALRELLLRRLDRAGRIPHVVEECRIMEDLEPNDRPFDPDDAFKLKGIRGLDDGALRVLRKLYAFREQQAEAMDRPTFKVIPNQTLIDLARLKPKADDDLGKVLSSRSSIRRRWGRGLLDAVTAGLADDSPVSTEPPKPPRTRRKGPRPRLTGRQADRATEALKQWRNRLCDENPRYTSHNVLSNGTLRKLATARPFDLEEMAAIPEVRSWQVRDFGSAVLAVLDEVDPRS
ncbi:MAG: HRDC domain-containing protein [Alphaproteobacteria bacterium]|nr:HRDC domain-containing protein [Alphaproteobacteria bacterium]MCB9692525.1 HRDC domain-containing protein [Alphaproteobacteria bacterium]